MSYRTHCDWCGESLPRDADQAVMTVTIYHRAGRGTLDAKWAEETRPTRHLCASPKEDTDRGGRNRMGLEPDEQLDSCYERAIAALRGTKLADPGMGLEWRLMPVEGRGEALASTTRAADDVDGRGERRRNFARSREPGGVDELEVDDQVRLALVRAGLPTIEQLATLDLDALLAVDQIGLKRARAILAALARHQGRVAS